MQEYGTDIISKDVDSTIRILAVASFLMVVIVIFDGWWHIAIGRDDFWILPHIGLYSSFFVIVVSFLYLFFRIRLPGQIKLLAFFGLGLIIISAPFDDWWHRNILPPGAKELGLGFASPPHLLFLAGGILTGWSIVRVQLSRTRNNHGLINYLYLVILAGQLMFIQAIDLLGPAYLGILGDFGMILHSLFIIAFYVFIQKVFANRIYVITAASTVGGIKALYSMDVLYLLSISLPGYLIALYGPVGSRRVSLLLGFFAGMSISSSLLFSVDTLGIPTVILRSFLAGFAGALGSFFSYVVADRYVSSVTRPEQVATITSQVKDRV
jgi:hypothetical protein